MSGLKRFRITTSVIYPARESTELTICTAPPYRLVSADQTEKHYRIGSRRIWCNWKSPQA